MSVEIGELDRQLTPHELEVIRTLPESEYGRVFLSLLEKQLARKREEYEDRPKVCDDPISEDFRVLLGEIRNLKWCLTRSQAAMEIIKQ